MGGYRIFGLIISSIRKIISTHTHNQNNLSIKKQKHVLHAVNNCLSKLGRSPHILIAFHFVSYAEYLFLSLGPDLTKHITVVRHEESDCVWDRTSSSRIAS